MAENCPFCGSDDLRLVSAGNNDSRVCCNNCEAQGPTGEDAIPQWNAALHKVQKQANELKTSIETLEATVSAMQKAAGTDAGTFVSTPLTP